MERGEMRMERGEMRIESGELRIEFNNPQKFNPDSDDAYYDKDTSGPEENYIVVDNFIWHRGKSNQNIEDVGENKGGFSFYYARHAYDDNDFYPILKTKNKKQVMHGRYYGVGQIPNEDKLLVIDVQEVLSNGKEYTRILSARLANDREEELYEQAKWYRSKREEHKRESTVDWKIAFQKAVENRFIGKGDGKMNTLFRESTKEDVLNYFNWTKEEGVKPSYDSFLGSPYNKKGSAVNKFTFNSTLYGLKNADLIDLAARPKAKKGERRGMDACSKIRVLADF